LEFAHTPRKMSFKAGVGEVDSNDSAIRMVLFGRFTASSKYASHITNTMTIQLNRFPKEVVGYRQIIFHNRYVHDLLYLNKHNATHAAYLLEALCYSI
jgi:hypothetical protein